VAPFESSIWRKQEAKRWEGKGERNSNEEGMLQCANEEKLDEA
jgi:hypothetical protein